MCPNKYCLCNNRVHLEYFNYLTHKSRLSSLACTYDLKPLVYTVSRLFLADTPTLCDSRENNVLDGFDRYYHKLRFQDNVTIRHKTYFYVYDNNNSHGIYFIIFRNKRKGNFFSRIIYKLFSLARISILLMSIFLYMKHILNLCKSSLHILCRFCNQYSSLYYGDKHNLIEYRSLAYSICFITRPISA